MNRCGKCHMSLDEERPLELYRICADAAIVIIRDIYETPNTSES
jgi:hypothetical protein